MKKPAYVLISLLSVALPGLATASDHDDGEMDLKGRSLNLTDLFAFREDWQSGENSDRNNLVLVMNSNPRSLPKQQYYFSSQARYEFHISRVGSDNNAAVTGKDDVTVRFTFSEPDSNKQQHMSMTLIVDGKSTTYTKTLGGNDIVTTNLANSTADNLNTLAMNQIGVGSKDVWVFAGLREDPFFFDVERFFKLRAFALGRGPASTFVPAAQACDFTYQYNVNSIVVRLPIELIAGPSGSAVFDIWQTISVPKK